MRRFKKLGQFVISLCLCLSIFSIEVGAMTQADLDEVTKSEANDTRGIDDFKWSETKEQLFVGKRGSELLDSSLVKSDKYYYLSSYINQLIFECVQSAVDNSDKGSLCLTSTAKNRGYKYILAYNNTYKAVKDGSVDFIGCNSISNALDNSTPVVSDYLYIDLNFPKSKDWATYKNDLNNCYILVFDSSDNPMYKIPYTKIGDYTAEFESSSEKTEEQLKNEGLVDISVKVSDAINDSKGRIIGHKVKFAWDLKYTLGSGAQDIVTAIGVSGVSDYVLSDGSYTSTKGECIFDVTGLNGNHEYTIYTAGGLKFTGKFKFKDIYVYEDDGSNDFDGTKPTVNISGIPSSAENGTTFDITMTSDVDAILTFNGRNNGGYGKSATFTISENGKYNYSAVSKFGVATEGYIEVNCFSAKKEYVEGDRDTRWTGDSETISSLAQTGIYHWYIFVIAGVLIIAGIFVLLNSKYHFIKKIGGAMNGKKDK